MLRLTAIPWHFDAPLTCTYGDFRTNDRQATPTTYCQALRGAWALWRLSRSTNPPADDDAT